ADSLAQDARRKRPTERAPIASIRVYPPELIRAPTVVWDSRPGDDSREDDPLQRPNGKGAAAVLRDPARFAALPVDDVHVSFGSALLRERDPLAGRREAPAIQASSRKHDAASIFAVEHQKSAAVLRNGVVRKHPPVVRRPSDLGDAACESARF